MYRGDFVPLKLFMSVQVFFSLNICETLLLFKLKSYKTFKVLQLTEYRKDFLFWQTHVLNY